MNTNNTPYTPMPEMQPQPGTMPEMPTQQPQMPGMPEMPRRRAPKNWQERFLSGNTGRPLTLQQERKLPNWLFGKSLIFFFVAFALCTFIFGYPMELELAIISSLSVVLFFYGAKTASQGWAMKKERAFIKNVFLLGLTVRLLWVLYCYFYFNMEHYGVSYGEQADVEWYMPFGEAIAQWIRDGFPCSLDDLMDQWYCKSVDDFGYPFWLAVVNILTGGESDVFVPFVLKCLASAYCAVCIYHIAKRHFGDGVARMAALFVALNPNMIYWCGNMFKETEMVYLCCLCVDLVDKTFTSKAQLTFKSLLPGLLAAMAVFFFRASLAIVLFLAMGAHIVMASNRVMSYGKKIIAGAMVGVVLIVGMGDRLRTQAESMMEDVRVGQQDVNMQWRARRAGGNSFAKYAGKAVFAPLIFTIPFPSFNIALESQILQRQLSGGSYIKNIFSFFVIWVMLTLLISGEWRRHVFVVAYTVGYLATLAMSNFAQSGRFHMPIWPFLMLFAALGIQMAKTTPKMRKWFTISLVAEVAVCLAWNWFKLKGRGMI